MCTAQLTRLKALSFEQIVCTLPSRKRKHSQWQGAQLLSVISGKDLVKGNGARSLHPILPPGQQCGAMRSPSSLPGTPQLAIVLLLSSLSWIRWTDRLRDIFQLPLAVFIITDMKGREGERVYRTSSLCRAHLSLSGSSGLSEFPFCFQFRKLKYESMLMREERN